ncbi:MAG TPA: YfiR family protein [Phycisphaerae bacterium]|nr:YfiR family protein [Phycisphaerae bacterium]
MRRALFQFGLILLLIGSVGNSPFARGEDAPSLEERVRAAFVFNFIQFTEWPEGTFSKAEDPIVIGVLGDAQILEALRAVAANKTANGRAVVVKELHSPEEAAGCQVAIVSGDGDAEEKTLEKVKYRSVMTVGDGESFTEEGGVFRFYVEDNKERFEVNTLAAERAHLQISSKLLKLAKIVRK